MEAKIAKEREKRVTRTAGYDNDEDVSRQDFGSSTELDELEAASSLIDRGEGNGWHEPPREPGLNPGALVGAAQFQDPREAELHVEENRSRG